MTPHRPCLDALTEAMALPRIDMEAENTLAALQGHTIPFPPWFQVILGDIAKTPRRQQGRIQDYGRRAG